MARGTQLRDLVQMLREDIASSTNAAIGVEEVPQLKRVLNAQQDALYEKYDWPFKKVKPFLPLNATQRYYDFPAVIDYDRIDTAVGWYNNLPRSIIRGISPADYAAFNSDLGVVSDPIVKWDIYDNGNTPGNPQIEVWPVPASNLQRIQFYGIGKCARMKDDADVCTLDDNLIVGFASAIFCARRNQKDAQIRLAAAQDLYNSVTMNSKGGEPVRTLGGGRSHLDHMNRAVVVVSGTAAP